MRQSDSADLIKEKRIARIKYANRQKDKFIKWSIKNRGRLKYKELVEIQERYGIKVY